MFLNNFLQKSQLSEFLFSENVCILLSHAFDVKFWHLGALVKNLGVILDTISLHSSHLINLPANPIRFFFKIHPQSSHLSARLLLPCSWDTIPHQHLTAAFPSAASLRSVVHSVGWSSFCSKLRVKAKGLTACVVSLSPPWNHCLPFCPLLSFFRPYWP